ncbi:putative acyl-CoA dehydrogenase IBR3 [Forsythia ovata]|uniref:Acyl-CoA dehydrogenase IBR3 n=1 Tax=Forsythia ovata TaxID=205694 RepID=A0ABD1VKM6_9LAMI
MVIKAARPLPVRGGEWLSGLSESHFVFQKATKKSSLIFASKSSTATTVPFRRLVKNLSKLLKEMDPNGFTILLLLGLYCPSSFSETAGLYNVVHLSPKNPAYDLLSKMLENDKALLKIWGKKKVMLPVREADLSIVKYQYGKIETKYGTSSPLLRNYKGTLILMNFNESMKIGNASGRHRAHHAGKKADAMIEITWAFIQRKSVLSEHPPSVEKVATIPTTSMGLAEILGARLKLLEDSIAQEHMQQAGKEIRDHTSSTGGKLVPSQKMAEKESKLLDQLSGPYSLLKILTAAKMKNMGASLAATSFPSQVKTKIIVL